MLRNKLSWALCILSAALMYLFENNAASFAVLLAVLAVPVVFIALNLAVCKKISAKLTVPEGGGKNRDLMGSLVVYNDSRLSAGRMSCRVLCKNFFTGAANEVEIKLSAGGKKSGMEIFAIPTHHCGGIQISASEFKAYDALGITARKIEIDQTKFAVIPPETFETDIHLSDNVAVMLDSDEYSMTCAGFDPSETYNIREYVPGDSIKSIHWKLSQKSEHLLVRELGLPVASRTLLLFESAVPNGAELPTTSQIDAMGEVFASISLELTRMGVAHSICWRNTLSDTLRELEIKADEDLNAALYELLSNPFAIKEVDIAESYWQSRDTRRFAHIVVVSPSVPQNVSALYCGNRITVLAARHDGGGETGGVNVRCFSEKTYAGDLSRLEL